MMLSEVSNLQIVMSVQLTLYFTFLPHLYLLRFQRAIENTEEGRLSNTIWTENGNLLSHLNIKCHIFEDGCGSTLISEGHTRELENRPVILILSIIHKTTFNDSQEGMENLIGGSGASTTRPAERFPLTQPPSLALILPRRGPHYKS